MVDRFDAEWWKKLLHMLALLVPLLLFAIDAHNEAVEQARREAQVRGPNRWS